MKQFNGYEHGINLGGWLSQCDHTKDRYENFIKQADIETISRWGMDHIRVPVDYDLVETADGAYKEEGFGYLQRIIDWCGANGLNMVLDLHKTYGFSFDAGEKEAGFFDNEAYQERFYKLWEQFAGRFGKYADRVAFELLNEVTDKEYCEKWNEISARCIERVRAICPDVYILIGGYYNNSVEALKDLRPPVDDRIVYNFHCYEPVIFTHQGAYWIEGMDTSFRMPLATTYGTYVRNLKEQLGWDSASLKGFDENAPFGTEFFDKWLDEAVRVAEERNVALYCGEYGVIDLASPEDALGWYRLICDSFDRHHIGRAAWSYREMDFGISDARMDGVRDELLKLL